MSLSLFSLTLSQQPLSEMIIFSLTLSSFSTKIKKPVIEIVFPCKIPTAKKKKKKKERKRNMKKRRQKKRNKIIIRKISNNNK